MSPSIATVRALPVLSPNSMLLISAVTDCTELSVDKTCIKSVLAAQEELPVCISEKIPELEPTSPSVPTSLSMLVEPASVVSRQHMRTSETGRLIFRMKLPAAEPARQLIVARQ